MTLLVVGYVFAQGPSDGQPDFVMIQYRTGPSNRIEIYSGTAQHTEVVQCKAAYAQNCVIDLLAQYKSKGYKIQSVSTVDYDLPSGSSKGSGQLILLSKE